MSPVNHRTRFDRFKGLGWNKELVRKSGRNQK